MLRGAYAYAKYIDCMRVRNSRLAGACSGGPVPETFQRPNGRSTAAPVEQFTLRIPAFARWRKSSINCVKLEKMAAASPCFIPLQSAIACSLALVRFRQSPPKSRLNFERSPSVAAGSVLQLRRESDHCWQGIFEHNLKKLRQPRVMKRRIPTPRRDTRRSHQTFARH